MGGYDHDILGIGNPNHPANQIEETVENFDSNNLQKSFQYYQETNDEDLLNSVFEYHNTTTQNSIDNLTKLVLVLRDRDNTYAANIIRREIEQLKTLLK